MRTRFADTSFWFARHEPQDRHHEVASRIDVGSRVVTTEWVLGETWTLVKRWGNHHGARFCLEAIRSLPGVEIETVTPADLKAAWAWLVRHDDDPTRSSTPFPFGSCNAVASPRSWRSTGLRRRRLRRGPAGLATVPENAGREAPKTYDLREMRRRTCGR